MGNDTMVAVTPEDRELAERLCFGMSEKAIGEAAMLIARHRQAHSFPGDVGTALGFGTGDCASLNLQGALDDLQGRYQVADGGVIARTIKCVIGQIEAVRAALPSHKGAGE